MSCEFYISKQVHSKTPTLRLSLILQSDINSAIHSPKNLTFLPKSQVVGTYKILQKNANLKVYFLLFTSELEM